jgi:hypothetical protein
VAAPETVVTTPAGGLGAALKALPAKARRKPSKAETARAEKLAALKAELEAVEDEAEASELAFAERRSALDAEEAAAIEDSRRGGRPWRRRSRRRGSRPPASEPGRLRGASRRGAIGVPLETRRPA